MLVVNKCERVLLMAKCKRCGKWGFFLKLNSFGQCEKCEKELAEAARLERERKKAAFWEELNNLPHAEIQMCIRDRFNEGQNFGAAHGMYSFTLRGKP